MTIIRKDLVDRMTKIYGVENPLVALFVELCEMWEDNNWNDICLTTLVEAHEDNPVMNDEV